MPADGLIPPLSVSLQVTQLQQIHSDWRQRLHRTVPPAVPVCAEDGEGLLERGWGRPSQAG